MTNTTIRVKLVEAGMKQCDLARLLGISEAAVSRGLRVELTKEIEDAICAVIDGNRVFLEKAKAGILAACHRKNISEQNKRAGKGYAERVYRSVSEAELNKEREREEWLYEQI